MPAEADAAQYSELGKLGTRSRARISIDLDSVARELRFEFVA